MTTLKPNDTSASDRELVITRVFNAPRERVWKAWTEPQHVAQWFGPRGLTTRVEALDFNVGGRWRYVMVDPDGKEYPCEGTFKEITPPHRIVTTDEFPPDYEGPTVQGHIMLTVLFEEYGPDKTRLTLRIMHDTADSRRQHEEMGVVGGWNSSFDCLDELLAGID